MKRQPRVRRNRSLTMAAAAAAFAAAVLLAACGSSSSSKTAAVTDSRQTLVRYAQCMRDNGVPDFPDPDANGQFRGSAHEQQGNPKFSVAQAKCRALAPGGEHENSGDPAYIRQARRYARCMRANGVPDFPDPDANGQFRGAGHEQQGNPQFSAAMETCRQFLPGGGSHQ